MSQILRVGIIGTGRAGQSHATAFTRLPNVMVTGLWNRTGSRAEKLAITLNQPDLKVYADWRDLIESGHIDIISIATDPVLRREPFALALSRNRHVLVEKPLSLGLSESQEMASLACQARSVTAISFNWRYSPGCQTTWRALRAGQIGRLLDVQTEWRLRIGPGLRPWSQVSGSLREAGSHEFDRIRFLTGWQFKRVVCSLRSWTEPATPTKGTPSCDVTAWMMAEMSDEAYGTIRLTVTPGEPERRITLCGEAGTVILRNEWSVFRPHGEEDRAMTLGNEVHVFRRRAGDAHPVRLSIAAVDRQPAGILSRQHTWNRLVADFVTAVRRGDFRHETTPHLPHISDGLAAQRVIHACEQSHIDQCWVNLNHPQTAQS